MARSEDVETPADRPAEAVLSTPRIIGSNFRSYQCFDVDLRDLAGGRSRYERDVLRAGAVVGVLPVDLVRRQLVLIRQFRLGAHLALDKGEMIEIVAGRCDAGESAEAAARRECIEEIGCAPRRLCPLMRLMPAPALTDEALTLFLAEVDTSAVPPRTGLTEEQEHLETIVLPIERAVTLLGGHTIHNAMTVIALQWLELNRAELPRLLDVKP
jgi:ADP-ribose pyrophosphatase